ncbi:MAG: MMPL family transporter [Pseudomonadales bacterium]|nr:MMPL family transporter [Pseudomonadales bacterium]
MNHRVTSIILMVLVSLVLGAGGANPEFSANQRDSFRADDPNLLNLIALEEEFSSEKNVFIVLEPDNKDVFDGEVLAVLQQVTELGWQIPYSQRVESLTNHLYTQVEEDDLLVEYLIEDGLSEQEVLKRKAYALDKEGVRDYLVSKEGSIALVSVTINLPLVDSASAAVETVDFVKNAVAELADTHPEIEFRVLGSVVMEVSMPQIVQEDSQTVIPLAFLIVVAFMVFLLRDAVANIAAIITCTLAIVAGMGLVLWTGVKMSPVLMNTPAIIIILGMADCIHLIVNYAQGLDKGLDKKAALQKSIEVNFKPIVFTSVTTAVSFLALNFSESPPFAHMGNAAAAGILFAMWASLTFLPAILYYLPSKASGIARLPKFERLITLYQGHGGKILVAFLLTVVTLASFIPQNKLDDNFVEWFDEELQFRKDFDLLNEKIGGSVVVNISIPANGPGGVLEPEYLQMLEDLDTYLNEWPEILYTASLVEVMKTLNQRMHGDDENLYRVPEQRNLASQYLLMYEMSLPFGQGLDNLINHDKSKSRVVAVFGKITDKGVIALESSVQQWLEERKQSDESAVLASANIAFAHMQYANINKLSKGFMLALLGISMLLILMFRSWSLGIVSIIPNLFPGLMAFGIWALISGKVGFGVSIGITLTLGIVVDDTIHLLSKYQYARKTLGFNNENSVKYAIETVGAAMLLTTIMVAIAFGAMLSSNFTPNQDIALITIITVVCAAVIDLVLLPIILLKAFSDKSSPSANISANKPEEADGREVSSC